MSETAAPGRGDTHNTISDGFFHGSVIQGRDFGIVDLNVSAPYNNPAISHDDEPGQE